MAGPSFEPRLQFRPYVAERTYGFAGREWLLEEIASWLDAPETTRAFLLIAEPGAGKTAIAGRVWETMGDRLHAVHFCSRANSEWRSPTSFCESLALQLQRFPAYAEALAVERDHLGTTQMTVQQTVHELSGGQVTGIYIANLVLGHGIAAEEAWVRLVQHPLSALEPEQPVVILIDALDEALGYDGGPSIVDFVAQFESLPHNVRFVLTCRPEARVLESLPASRTERVLGAGEGLERSRADVRAYIEQRVVGTTVLAGDLAPAHFVALASARSDGNYLYARHLLQYLESRDEPVTAASLDALPSGLSAIYLALLRQLIESEWPTLYGPLLGTLAVAYRPLTVPELARFTGTDESQVWQAIDALGQLLDAEADTFQLYHRSFAEFLLAGGSAARGYGLHAADQHARIVEGYRSAGWQADDDYGLRHLPAHLAALGDPALFEVINERFMRAKLRRFGSHQPFAADVQLALDAAIAADPRNVAEEARASLLLATLGGVAGSAPLSALSVLIRRGEVERALGYARLIADPEDRARALAALAQHAPNRASLLDEASAVALVLRDPQQRFRALAAVVRGSVAAGDGERAEYLVRQALQRLVDLPAAASFLDSALTRPAAAGHFAYLLAQAGRVESAAALARDELTGDTAITVLEALVEAAATAAAEPIGALADSLVAANPEPELRARIGFARAQMATAAGRPADARAALAEGMTAVSAIGDDWTRENERERGAALFGAAGFAVDATALARQIASEGTGEIIVTRLTGIADALVHGDSATEALAVLSLAGDVAARIDDPASLASSMAHLAAARSRAGDQPGADEQAKTAAKVALSIEEPVSGASALGDAAEVLAELGHWREASDVARAVPFASQQARALSVAAHAAMTAGAFVEAVAIAGEILGARDRAHALADVACALAENGRLDEAAEIARSIRPSAIRAAVLGEIAASTGAAERAAALADEAITASEESDRDQTKAQALEQATGALLVHGRADLACETAEAALAAARAVIDEPSRAKALAAAKRALQATHSPTLTEAEQEAAEAAAVAEALTANQGVSRFHYEWVWELAEEGKVDQALRSADILRGLQRARAFAGIARIVAGQSQTARGREALVAATAATDALEDPAERAIALGDNAQALAALGDAAEAEASASAAAELADQVTSAAERATLLAEMVRALADAGSAVAARRLFHAALAAARAGTSSDVFAVIGAGAGMLAGLDGGTTLLATARALIEVDEWWSSPLPHASTPTSAASNRRGHPGSQDVNGGARRR